MKKLLFTLFSLSILFSLVSCDEESGEYFGEASVTFKATYGENPLVIGNEYDFPGGGKILLDKVRLYLSDFSISGSNDQSTSFDEVMELNFTSSNTNLSGAESGISFTQNQAPVANYSNLRFNLGLSKSLNSQTPADYPAGHPLANTDPYWADWESYIFTTISGRADMDSDGIFETGFVYHLGGDSVNRKMNFDDWKTLSENGSINYEFVIDLYKVFDHNGDIFDVENINQVHIDLDVMEGMADRLVDAISLTK